MDYKLTWAAALRCSPLYMVSKGTPNTESKDSSSSEALQTQPVSVTAHSYSTSCLMLRA